LYSKLVKFFYSICLNRFSSYSFSDNVFSRSQRAGEYSLPYHIICKCKSFHISSGKLFSIFSVCTTFYHWLNSSGTSNDECVSTGKAAIQKPETSRHWPFYVLLLVTLPETQNFEVLFHHVCH
jgi:hypothetical protein